MKDRKTVEIKILDISIWRIFVYFILYSIAGFAIETIYGIITMGIWQSRQSFLYGPFCGIYGLGAVLIILFSKYFNKNNFTLFVGGCLLGMTVEYLTSFFVEVMLHTRWWDYSARMLNLNGRICLLYTAFWGVLTIFLIKRFNPFVDRLVNKIKNRMLDKTLKIFLIVTILFIFLDCLITCYAQDKFLTRMIVENNIEVNDINKRYVDYEKLKSNPIITGVIEKLWNNEKMIKTFPNIKVEDKNNNVIYIDSLLPDIQPYYLKIFDK